MTEKAFSNLQTVLNPQAIHAILAIKELDDVLGTELNLRDHGKEGR